MGSRARAKFRLEKLLGKRLAARFFRDAWPGRFFFAREAPALRELSRFPFLFDLDLITRRYRDPVHVWLPRGRSAAGTDSPEKRVSADAASLYHRSGATVYFPNLERFFPELQRACRQLESELKLLPGVCRMEFFASRAGSGAGPHFDQQHNLNLQLTGRKSWVVAENREIPFPLEHFKTAFGKPAGEMRLYAEKPVPKQMPRGSSRFAAKPGSVVFLPQGIWHSTRALEDSLALTISIQPPAWVDLLLNSIRRRLVVEPLWRQRAFLEGGDPMALAALEASLAKVPGALEGLNLGELTRGFPERP